MVSYIPSLERFVSENKHLVSNGIKRFLASWYGRFLVAALCAALLSCLGHTVWKSLRSIVLTNWHTKCSIPKDCIAYDQVHSWVWENPGFQDGTSFQASATTSRNGLDDNGVEFTRNGEKSVGDIQKIQEDDIVSGSIPSEMEIAL